MPRFDVKEKESIVVIVNEFHHVSFLENPNTAAEGKELNILINVKVVNEVVKVSKLSLVEYHLVLTTRFSVVLKRKMRFENEALLRMQGHLHASRQEDK